MYKSWHIEIFIQSSIIDSYTLNWNIEMTKYFDIVAKFSFVSSFGIC